MEKQRYKVNTDEEFFNSFNELPMKFHSVAYPFQNPNTELTHDEFKEWNDKYQSLLTEINNHYRECYYRISRITIK